MGAILGLMHHWITRVVGVLVDLGAAMMVASTMVPPKSFIPLARNNSPTLLNIEALKFYCSSKWPKFIIVIVKRKFTTLCLVHKTIN